MNTSVMYHYCATHIPALGSQSFLDGVLTMDRRLATAEDFQATKAKIAEVAGLLPRRWLSCH
jgi:hypothetical protein